MSKAYFLAPTRDTPPKGPIFLGSIIKSPRSPELSLNGKKSPFLKDLEITSSSIPGASRTVFKTGNRKAGVWAEFVDGVGIGGKVNASWDNVEMAVYKFDELITQTISPDFAEIITVFNEAPVQQAIKESMFKDNLYMITGIKIAKGADVAISKIKARGKNFQFGIDTTPAGVPLKFGPDFSANSADGQGLTEKHKDEFIFAYRLREISYKRKKATGHEEYLKGDLMGYGEKEGQAAVRDESKDETVLSEFLEEAATLLNLDLEPIVAVDDDGEEVVCISLEEEDDEDEDE